MNAPQRLTDGDEVLLRQVHPIHVKGDGTMSSSAFSPTKRDEGMMSTTRGSVGPAEAHRQWVEDRELQSLGTWGVSVAEIDAVEVTDLNGGDPLTLRALDDAVVVDVEDHASVDFTSMTTAGLVRQASRKLIESAQKRGRLHP